MAADFSGTWNSCKSEGWVDFLAKVGVPKERIPAGINVTEEICQVGDAITIKTTNRDDGTVKEKVINVGSNFTTELLPGKEMEFTTAWEGDMLVLRRPTGEKTSTRKMEGSHMVLIIEHDGAVAKTYYNKA